MLSDDELICKFAFGRQLRCLLCRTLGRFGNQVMYGENSCNLLLQCELRSGLNKADEV